METNHIRIDHEVASVTPERDTLHDYQCRQLLVSFPSASIGIALRTERRTGSNTPDQ